MPQAQQIIIIAHIFLQYVSNNALKVQNDQDVISEGLPSSKVDPLSLEFIYSVSFGT